MSTATKNNINEADAKRIALFADLITVGSDAEYIHKMLNGIYRKYTRMLLRSTINDMDNVFVDRSTDEELYYLSELIAVLNGDC